MTPSPKSKKVSDLYIIVSFNYIVKFENEKWKSKNGEKKMKKK